MIIVRLLQSPGRTERIVRVPVKNHTCHCSQGGGSGGGCGSSAGPSATSMAGLEQQLGVNPQELMQRLMARPDMVAKIQDPEVSETVFVGVRCSEVGNLAELEGTDNNATELA